jgi:hypothetical protein
MRFLIILTLLGVLATPLAAQLSVSTPQSDDAAKCKVTVSWSRRGVDATVSVTVKNGSSKKMKDPVIRVRFYDANGEEVVSDSKAYFVTIGPKASKKLESRIWSDVPPEAKDAKGEVVTAVFGK